MIPGRLREHSGIAVAALAFGVYAMTRSPSVGSMDAGELAAAAHRLGVAHPTGYPLFLLLAKAFSTLPLPGAGVIVKLNLMAALLCGTAVFLFHRLFLRLTRSNIAASGGALILAFSRTFWAQGTSTEVYALHLVFVATVLLFFLPPDAASLKPPVEGRRWHLFAYVVGLSFANHMMTLMLAPALLAAFFATQGFGRAAWSALARAVPPFALGISVYAYLPVRAARHPVMNWGDPSTWHGFLRHVSAAQFREWMFASPQIAVRGLVRFAAGLPAEFAVVPLIAAGYGLIRMRRGDPGLFLFSLLLFAGCVLFAINYDIPDTEAYFLVAQAVIALWGAFGLRELVARVSASGRRVAGLAGLVLLAIVPLAANWKSSERRGDFAAEDFARNLLGSLPPNALLFSDASSGFYFTASWLQFVEGFRPDVAVVGYRALAFPWHLDELETRYPGVLEPARAEAIAYRIERARFERGSRDSAAYAARFVAMTRALIDGAAARRPVYVTPDVSPAWVAPWRAAPDGLALRLFAGDSLPALSPRAFAYRPLRDGDPEAVVARAAYAAAHCYQGIYQALRGDTAAAVSEIRKSLAVSPGYPPALDALRRLGAEP